MEWSDKQKEIFKIYDNTNQNIIIRATAGSGKTTTLIELSKRASKYKKSIFLAFNKRIVEELRDRLPIYIDCMTLHAFGYKQIASYFKTNFKVNDKKIFIFLTDKINEKKVSYKKEGKEFTDKMKFSYMYNMLDIISYIRMKQIPLDIENINQLCDCNDITTIYGEVEDSIDIVKNINTYNLNISKQNNIIDYVDMICMPSTINEIYVEKYDNIFIDEIQDLNEIQRMLVMRMMKPTTRIVGVGDPDQCIYSFMGADINSFNKFTSIKNTITLPLDICYRCGSDIVEKARTIFPDVIKSFEKSEKGIVRNGLPEEIQLTDYVLCRNNRPLFSMFFYLLSRGVSSFIVGKDIMNGLKIILNKVNKYSKEKAFEMLDEMLDKLLIELINKGVNNPTNHPRYQSLFEKIKVISIISDMCKSMSEVENKIDEIFAEKKDAVKLMTIHKSKGLENDRVFIIEKFEGVKLLPSKYANQDWEKVQEKNLEFVAYTRAKKELVIIQNFN